MSLVKLIRYSGGRLAGQRIRAAFVGLLPFAAELLFRFGEAAVFGFLLYFGAVRPSELFSGNTSALLAASAACIFLRRFTSAPLMLASADWFTQVCQCRLSPSFTLNGRMLGRSLAASAWSCILGAVMLLPVLFFGGSAVRLVSQDGSGFQVFMAFHAATLTAASVYFLLKVRLSLTAVPFMLVQFPQISPLKTVLKAVRFTNGRRGEILGVMLVCIVPALTVIGIPAAVMTYFSAMSTLTEIAVCEDDYRTHFMGSFRGTPF